MNDNQLIEESLAQDVNTKKFKLALLSEIKKASESGLSDEVIFGAIESVKHISIKALFKEMNRPEIQEPEIRTFDDTYIGYR